ELRQMPPGRDDRAPAGAVEPEDQESGDPAQPGQGGKIAPAMTDGVRRGRGMRACLRDAGQAGHDGGLPPDRYSEAEMSGPGGATSALALPEAGRPAVMTREAEAIPSWPTYAALGAWTLIGLGISAHDGEWSSWG